MLSSNMDFAFKGLKGIAAEAATALNRAVQVCNSMMLEVSTYILLTLVSGVFSLPRKDLVTAKGQNWMDTLRIYYHARSRSNHGLRKL